MLRTSAGPLGRLWQRAYALAGRAVAVSLARRHGAEVVLRGAGAGGGFVPGLSDVDLLAIAPAGAVLPEPPRERRLWGLVQADIYRADELTAILGSTAATFGLESLSAAYHGSEIPRDPTGLLDRPGLPHEAAAWRHLAGPRLGLRAPAADRDATLVAAWAELVTWWRFGLEALHADVRAPSDAYLCVKLVAEPLRVLLTLDGRRVQSRDEALALGAGVAPELAGEIDAARALLHRLHRSPDAPLEATVPTLAALSERIARRIGAELGDGARVGLGGAGSDGNVPLADWRAVVAEPLPGKRLVRCEGDPASAADLRRLSARGDDAVTAILWGGLLVEPVADPWYLGRMRTLQARFTDPVSFALLEGSPTASFPAVRGWSASDWARRAVAEWSAWLGAAGRLQARPATWRRPPDAAGSTAEVARHLLASARAALFSLSLSEGEPTLLLEAGAVAAATGEAAGSVVASLSEGGQPRAADVDALRDTVAALLDRARRPYAPS